MRLLRIGSMFEPITLAVLMDEEKSDKVAAYAVLTKGVEVRLTYSDAISRETQEAPRRETKEAPRKCTRTVAARQRYHTHARYVLMIVCRISKDYTDGQGERTVVRTAFKGWREQCL